MPIYEFDCASCGRSFDKLVRSMAGTAEVVCPACGSANTHKKISLFAAPSGGRAGFDTTSAACSTGST